MSKQYSYGVSVFYQIIIIVCFAVLFGQLYGLATSMYRDNQFNLQIKEFRAGNEKRKGEIMNKKLEDAANALRSMTMRAMKESEGKVYKDEEVYIIEGSEKLAHNKGEDPEMANFAPPTVSANFEADSEEILLAVKKKEKVDQWKYYFFKL